MIVTLGVVALILGITYYQALQGLYSSLIMAILTVLCAAVAVNFYEPLASAFLYTRQPAYADAIALTALFVLPLLGLRIAADLLIVDNVILDRWMDRLGGGLAGLVTGILLVGIFMLAVQMLPFDPNLIDYRPFNETLQREDRLIPYPFSFFSPDEFTIGLGKMFSGGAFSGRRSFAHAHDDLLLELYCARNRPNRERKFKGHTMLQSRLGRFDAMPGHLKVKAAYECEPQLVECGPQLVEGEPQLVKQWSADDIHPLLRQEPLSYEKNNARKPELRKIVVIRTLVDKDVREGKDSQKAANWWLLPATQFRLVSKKGKNYYPIGYLTYLDREQSIKEIKTASLKRKATTTPSDKSVMVEWQGAQIKLWVRPEQWKFIGADHDKTKSQWFLTDLIIEREWAGDKTKALVVDWVYRMPVKEVPAYMVFRRVAKAAIPTVKVLTGKESGKAPFPKEFIDRMLGRKI